MSGAPQTGTAETTIHFTHSDHLGSGSVITGTGGGVRQQLDYLPFGEEGVNEQTPPSGQGIGEGDLFDTAKKFTGKELDADTGLYYYGARYYNPNLSRFVSRDPLQDRTMEMISRQEMNGYAYTKNNPINSIDENGEYTVSEAKLAIAHPINARKAKEIADYAYSYTQDHFTEGLHNGEADAFRHTFWNALMTKEFGADFAKKVGDAHEDYAGNPFSEKQMDLYNNARGREIGREFLSTRENWEEAADPIAQRIFEAIQKGQLQTELIERPKPVESDSYYDPGYYLPPPLIRTDEKAKQQTPPEFSEENGW